MNSHLLNSHLDRHPAAGAAVHGVDAMIDAARKVLATAFEWNRRRHQRKSLAELDEHMLRDIGIDRHQALIEASKPFWRG